MKSVDKTSCCWSNTWANSYFLSCPDPCCQWRVAAVPGKGEGYHFLFIFNNLRRTNWTHGRESKNYKMQNSIAGTEYLEILETSSILQCSDIDFNTDVRYMNHCMTLKWGQGGNIIRGNHHQFPKESWFDRGKMTKWV